MRRLWVTLLLVAVATGCQPDGRDEPAAGPRPLDAQQAPAAVPLARTEVGAGRLGDRIAVAGGLLADGSATPRVDLYDLGTRRWQPGPDLPEALHHAGVATFRDRLFVAGGYTQTTAGAWAESSGVFSLGAGDERWRAEPSLRVPRGALGLASSDGFLVAFGGTSGGQVVNSVEILAAGGDRWRAGPAMNRRREHTAAAESEGRIYAIAGRVGGLETNLDAVESLDPAATDAGWRVEPALNKARGGIAAASAGGTICVAGGEEPGATIAGVECLTDGQWRPVATLATPRHGLGVVAGNGNDLHVLAGGPEPGLFVSDAHEIISIP